MKFFSTLALVKRVTAFFDPEASVWVATSDDIPGLATEGATLDELRQKVAFCVSELIELNAHQIADASPAYELVVAESLA